MVMYIWGVSLFDQWTSNFQDYLKAVSCDIPEIVVLAIKISVVSSISENIIMNVSQRTSTGFLFSDELVVNEFHFMF